jgi:Tol biopolymer transport system component
LKQITFGDFANFDPNISPDGKWILFVSYRSGIQSLWKLSVDGGEPQQVTEVHSALGMFSPDGKLIGAAEVVASGSPPWQLALITVDGSSPVKLITPPTHFNLRDTLAWSPEGRAILVKSDQGGVGNLWSQPIDGSAPKQITNFTSDLISWFAVSHDGKRLAISRGNSALDVVLIKDFR